MKFSDDQPEVDTEKLDVAVDEVVKCVQKISENLWNEIYPTFKHENLQKVFTAAIYAKAGAELEKELN